MIEKWTKKLEEIHTEVNILLRDGVANWIAWKSVDHLHFHLIPDCQVYSSNSWWDRKIYSDNALAKEVQDLKNRLNMK
jgi:diadenosine tetraphosphate (Ap4A) HIT family hydrolase